MTSETAEVGWQLSTKPISRSNSIPGNTLAPLYDNENANSTFWGLYNDSPPDINTNGKYGHTKGVVITNSNEGLWLIHSVPNFPPLTTHGEQPRKRISEGNATLEANVTVGKYEYPTSGQINGQSFLCITLGGDQFDTVGKQLMYNQIIVYDKNIPPALGKKYPVLTDAVNQVRIREPPYNNKAVIRSLGSLNFTSFAKSDKWQKDLYDEFVAPQLNSDLLVQSWLNGRGRLPTDCTSTKVYNIESLVLKVANVDFTSSRDHSKWAVTLNDKPNRGWVCVGDINRADTQYSRGGGTVCFKVSNVWKNYRNSVNDVEPCPKKRF